MYYNMNIYIFLYNVFYYIKLLYIISKEYYVMDLDEIMLKNHFLPFSRPYF